MDLFDKLTILADSAKYDVSCTSSGVERKGNPTRLGSTAAAGICHSFSTDQHPRAYSRDSYQKK